MSIGFDFHWHSRICANSSYKFLFPAEANKRLIVLETVLGSTSTANHLFFFLVSCSTTVVVNWLNNSRVFDFFVARKFELRVKFGKPFFADNNLFQREPEQKWHFRKVSILVLRDEGEFDLNLSNRVFRIAQASESNVDLRSDVQIIFLTRFCEKTFFPERRLLFSIVRLRFNCFWILFMSSYRLVHHMFSWIGKCKFIFSMWICRRSTCTENNFSCRAIELACFQTWFMFMAMRFFGHVLRNKTVFSEMNWGRNNLFSKKFVFDTAQWTFNCFQKMVFWHTKTVNQNFGELRETKISFLKWFVEEQLFQRRVLFSDLINELFIVFRGGFEIAKIRSFIISWVRRCKSTVFDVNLWTNDLFRKFFYSRPCIINAYLFSNVVCGLAERFTSNVKTKSEKY